jgi:uncharacterized protein (UPF0335 family)
MSTCIANAVAPTVFLLAFRALTGTGGIGHSPMLRHHQGSETMAGSGGIASAQLKSIVERIERLEEEKKALTDDIRDVYAEAKANGFDAKTLRSVVRMRKQDRAEREEQAALLDLYLHALGMIPDAT